MSKEDKKEAIKNLTRIEGVGESRAENLYENGFESPEEIVESGLAGMAEVTQIGFQMAKSILANAEKVVEGEVEREQPNSESSSGEDEDSLVKEMEDLEESIAEGEDEEDEFEEGEEEIEHDKEEEYPEEDGTQDFETQGAFELFENIESGSIYIWEMEDEDGPFKIMERIDSLGKFSLISDTHPRELISKYEIEIEDSLWISDSDDPVAISPENLDDIALETRMFSSLDIDFILIDAFEILFAKNESSDVISSLKKIEEEIEGSSVTLVFSVSPSIGENNLKLLKEKLDVIEISEISEEPAKKDDEEEYESIVGKMEELEESFEEEEPVETEPEETVDHEMEEVEATPSPGEETPEMEDELGSLLESIGGPGETEAEPDFELAKEIDEWIEDTVGIEAHVGEESRCPICGEIVSIYQSRCDRCGVDFVEGEVKCDVCGSEVNPEAVRCPECDEPLVDEKTLCPICESVVYVSEDVCQVCETEFYEEEVRCDDCKSKVPIDSIVCPNCDAILRQKIMEEHMETKMEGKVDVSSEKTEVDIGGMNIQLQGGPETASERTAKLSDLGGDHSTDSGRILFPFPAVVNQQDMKRALLLNAVNQDIGGVLIEGHRGTAKSVAIRGLSEILPEIEVVEDCRFSCDPKNPDEWCWECEEKYGDVPVEEIPVETRPVKVIDLPLNATEDRVVGTLDVEKMIQEGVKAFQEGILAEVNRGILYVDEINLLDDFIVDVLLDAAAMGRVTVEREDISVTYPSNFILVGSMNPEEGALRPQLLDRLALNVKVVGIPNSEERRKIIERREKFNENPQGFREEWNDEISALKEKVGGAKERLERVEMPNRMDDVITKVSVDFEVDGHRPDIIMRRTARTNAAFEGRTEVKREDVTLAAKMALPHRMKKGPLEEQEFSVERLKRLVRQYS